MVLSKASGIGRCLGLALIGLSPLVCAGAAQGQSLFDRTANVTVQDRPRPEYDPAGQPLGVGFTLFPKLTVGETFDDNVMELPSSDLLDVLAQELPNPQAFTHYTDKLRPLADTFLTLEPNVTIKSNWNQNSFTFAADAIVDRAASHPDLENSIQYSFVADGVLNVRHDLTVDLDASYIRKLLPRTFDGYVLVISAPSALAVAASLAPLYSDTADAKLEVIKDFARFRVTASGEFQNVEYPNGFGPAFVFANISKTNKPDPSQSLLVVGQLNQGYHNHDDYNEFMRVDYAFSPDFALFLEETLGESQYPNITFRNRFDSATLAGVNFQVPGLITAEIGVGNLYSHVYFAGLKAIDTPDFSAKIAYFPTPLIDVTFTASEFIVDSGVPQAPNYLDKAFDLQANYELLRNLILNAHASINLEDYRAIDRHLQIYDQGIGATYLLNRGLRVTLAYTHRQFTSDGTQAVARQFNEFNENWVSLALTLQY